MKRTISKQEAYVLNHKHGDTYKGYILYPHEIMSSESGMTYGGKSTPVTDWYLKAIPAALKASGVLEATDDAYDVFFGLSGVHVNAGTFTKVLRYDSEECPEIIRDHYYELEDRFKGMFSWRGYTSVHSIISHTKGTYADEREINELWNSGEKEKEFVLEYLEFLAQNAEGDIRKAFCRRSFIIFKSEVKVC